MYNTWWGLYMKMTYLWRRHTRGGDRHKEDTYEGNIHTVDGRIHTIQYTHSQVCTRWSMLTHVQAYTQFNVHMVQCGGAYIGLFLQG